MSRPAPVLTASGRADDVTGSPSLRRARPPRTAADVVTPRAAVGWGPHPDALAHHAPPAAAPVRRADPPRPDPALLPALAPRPDRPLSFVQRVTLMLQRLTRSPGRHRTGHSAHHWSMFAPHPAARRRPGGRGRR